VSSFAQVGLFTCKKLIKQQNGPKGKFVKLAFLNIPSIAIPKALKMVIA
jgi:hypothetical protein